MPEILGPRALPSQLNASWLQLIKIRRQTDR